MASRQPQSVLPQLVVDSYNKHGESFYGADYSKKRQNPSKTLTYMTNKFKDTDGKMRKAIIKATGATVMGGVKSPEDRGEYAPCMVCTIEDVDANGQPYGEAVNCMDKAHAPDIEQAKEKKLIPKKGEIHNIVQRETKEGEPLDVPVFRPRFRSKSKEDRTLRCDITVFENGTERKTAKDGSPFTLDNIHEDVTSGSIATFILDLSTLMHSSMGYSNQCSVEVLYIQPNRSGGALTVENEFSAEDRQAVTGGVLPDLSKLNISAVVAADGGEATTMDSLTAMANGDD